MSGEGRELALSEIPAPPLFALATGSGDYALGEREINGEPASVGAVFASPELAEEFSGLAPEYGMEEVEGLRPLELEDREAVAQYAMSGEDYVLVISHEGAGLFYAEDVAEHAREVDEMSFPFPLYLFSDNSGEAPLIRVEEETGELMVAALFTTPGKAETFRAGREHLELPETVATIEDGDGLRRHALIARRAGADYAVIDPEFGHSEAIPLEELI